MSNITSTKISKEGFQSQFKVLDLAQISEIWETKRELLYIWTNSRGYFATPYSEPKELNPNTTRDIFWRNVQDALVNDGLIGILRPNDATEKEMEELVKKLKSYMYEQNWVVWFMGIYCNGKVYKAKSLSRPSWTEENCPQFPYNFTPEQRQAVIQIQIGADWDDKNRMNMISKFLNDNKGIKTSVTQEGLDKLDGDIQKDGYRVEMISSSVIGIYKN